MTVSGYRKGNDQERRGKHYNYYNIDDYDVNVSCKS